MYLKDKRGIRQTSSLILFRSKEVFLAQIDWFVGKWFNKFLRSQIFKKLLFINIFVIRKNWINLILGLVAFKNKKYKINNWFFNSIIGLNGKMKIYWFLFYFENFIFLIKYGILSYCNIIVLYVITFPNINDKKLMKKNRK